MEIQDPTADPVINEPTVGLTLEVESDPTLGYAHIQNAIPVVRSLRLAHNGTEALENLELIVTCSPRFAQGIRLRFERILPGETRFISPIDLHPDHDYLSGLQESVNASIEVVAVTQDSQLACLTKQIEVLAYDQWAGTRALPELLAAFCMPNNPAIDVLVGKASVLLRTSHNDLSMDGYQSKSRDVVWKQISAIYSTIAAENLQYAEPPASFGTDGQKIRTPDRIIEGRVATCLDLAILFASCMEQAGLRPLVLFKEGHAWVGAWLHEASFPDPLVDDVQAIRKRVDSGEILVFECTGVAQHHSHRPSLRIAMEQGRAHLLEDDTFRHAVDIRRAREVQIKPLPSRNVLTRRVDVGQQADTAAAIEPTPHLPPLDPEFLVSMDSPAEDTPEGRLSKWKSKLLDLTLRNRLLNFKVTKSTLPLIVHDLAKLEDALAEGVEFNIRPLPEIMEGADPRMAQVHASRGGNAPLDDMALAALQQKDLLTRVPKKDLDGALLTTYNAARLGLEEGGANTLYLALGLLRWTEAERAESEHLAPILLVPVTLQRQSVRSGFRLSRHDDETIVNPTLLQLLQSNFDLRVAGLDVMPTDGSGVDVEKILQSFRLAVREIPRWEVIDQAYLGIFSFTKYLMWKDLQDRSEQLKENRVVRHLIEHPGEAFTRSDSGDEFSRLDETHRPQDILTPMLSDSSQLKAICSVDAGRDLVLEGPPGTGKSQTITNLIAHNLAKGRSVLFVSEKMAALQVVRRRLDEIGLGPFCLELHSSTAKKTAVLEQLGQSLNMASQRTAAEWEQEADRLSRLRRDLNGLVESLHRVHRNGLTVYKALGTCIENSGSEPATLPWPDPLSHSPEDLELLRQTVRRMSALAGELGELPGHALGQIGRVEWSPTWQDNLLAASTALGNAISAFRDMTGIVAKIVNHEMSGLSLDEYRAFDRIADVLLATPKISSGFARRAHDSEARSQIRLLAKHGLTRKEHWQRLEKEWRTDLAQLNGLDLRNEWSAAKSAWWPKSWFAMRAVTSRLLQFYGDSKRPTESNVEAMLPVLVDVNDEDQILQSMRANAESLLGDAYVGAESDWVGIALQERWAEKFVEAVTAVTGTTVQIGDSLQKTLQTIVSENPSLLAPNGAVGRPLLQYRDAWRAMSQCMNAVNTLAEPVEPLEGPAGANGSLERVLGILDGWQREQRLLQPWCLWRDARRSANDQGLQAVVASVESGLAQLATLGKHFEHSYRNWWLKKTIDNDSILRTFSSADHALKIDEFREADARFEMLTRKFVVASLAGRVPSASGAIVGTDSELGRLRREMQKQRRHLPVRQLIRGLPTLLPKLKPCLLMSPLSVAQYLDAGHAQFDLVVFDEASQIPVWDAVGAIARGTQLVVVGDPKQLPPTNFFNRADSDGSGIGDDQVEDLESILDECLAVGMNRLSLEWHYRSRHESLISFSNFTYYGSRLITFPSPVTDDIAVRLERIDGCYDRGGTRTNRAEAEAIVKGIERHYLSKDEGHLSIGVVTFNQTQQALIETLLDDRRRKNQVLDQAIAASSHEPLFIKNLENVQGDERDVIFFSITYGPDAAGKVTMNFGPLNGEGGHRRLNVAISRAREAVVIYSTIMPEQIDLARIRTAGVRDLKHYLEFAIRGSRALAEQSNPTGLEPDSPFELAVIGTLRARGWDVHPQVGCSGYRIDIGVVDPRLPGRYLAGIECDGRTYHSGATARDRDRLRQFVLERLGWRIHRIWSTDWWRNPEREIEKVISLLEEQLKEEQEKEGEEDSVIVPEGWEDPSTMPNPYPQILDEEGGGPIPQIPEEGGGPISQRYYKPASIEGGSPVLFYEYQSAQAITMQLAIVVLEEGPIAEPVLFRKVARAWGLGRTGSIIVRRLRARMPPDVKRTTEPGNTFYWPPDSDPKIWKDFRIAEEGVEESQRNISEVCLEEISAIAVHVLGEAGASSKQDVCRVVGRLLGMARMPAAASARADEAIEMLVKEGVVTESDGYILLANDNRS